MKLHRFIFSMVLVGILTVAFIFLYETIGVKAFVISGFAVICAKLIMHEIITDKKE